MKIKSLLIGMLACSALVACTNDDLLENNEPQNGKVNESYIAVNLKTTNTGSRATSDSFEDGRENENLVSGNILFFFFDGEGNKYNVAGENNFISVPVSSWTAEGTANANSIEEVSSPVLVIEESKNVPPQKILAILNPPTNLIKSQSLTELKGLVGAYNYTSATANTFVMTNSTYKHSATGAEVIATELSPSNICTSAELAEKAPVDIYVERVAAKVRVSVEYDQLNGTAFSVGNAYTMSDGSTQAIYAKIKGWEVTNIKNEANLLKKISLDWDATNIGLTWNDAANHRSYWADTETPNAPTHPWSWTTVDNKVTENENWDYYYENTGDNKSQLLVAVEFCDAKGDQVQIAEWFGTKYSVPALKVAIANTLSSQIFIKASEEATTATSIQAGDIDFVQVSDEVVDGKARYWSEAILAKDSEKKLFVDASMKTLTLQQVKDIIATVQHAKIWAKGGYYYQKIEHFGNKESTTEFGMVRNHLYDFTINGISGLGTPVLDETKIITPEKPADEASFIAARINILSWRLVENNDVTLQ